MHRARLGAIIFWDLTFVHKSLRISGFGGGSRAKDSDLTDVTATKPPTWRLIDVPGSYRLFCCYCSTTVQRFNTVHGFIRVEAKDFLKKMIRNSLNLDIGD